MNLYNKKTQRSDSRGNWPQKWFRDKPCKNCKTVFTPTSPCNLYCSEQCEIDGSTSAYLKRNYGIDLSWYKAKLEEQNHLCAICKKEGFVMNPDRHRLKLVVDHCHSSGNPRGLLCHNCNRGLGLFADNTLALVNAINYLEGATTIPKGSTLKRVEAPDSSVEDDDIVCSTR